jgi:hypothetical protein
MLFIIIATGVIAYLLVRKLAYMTSSKRKAIQLQQLLVRFSELGTANDLAFTSQLILRNRIIGLDGIKKTLLVMEVNAGNDNWYLVALDEMIGCKVKMIYKRISTRSDEENLDKILIRFEKSDYETIVLLPFYESGEDSVLEATTLAKKADHWESMLSKLINNNIKKIA